MTLIRKAFFVCALSGLAGCGEPGDGDGDEAALGTARLRIGAASVAAFFFEVRDAGGAIVESRFVAVEDEPLPTILAPGAAEGHRFADAYFALPAGDYTVTATPMDGPEDPSEDCAPVTGAATVVAGQTNEIVLVSVCASDVGGLDVIATTDDAPDIQEVIYDASKFILACEDLTVTVVATDPEGEAISYAFALISQPAGAIVNFAAVDGTLAFSTDTAGDYEVQVTVCDALGACSPLTFPIHVQPNADCGGQVDEHALFANGPGYACPTGATTFTFVPPLDPTSSDQARQACEACYGVGSCFEESADCAGLGWGPRPAGAYVCGEAYFGYQNGCSGDDGRAWGICNSFTTYGYWGKF